MSAFFQFPDTHFHGYTALITAPTCTEAGYTAYTCPCGDSYTDQIRNPLGHSWTALSGQNGETCTRCGIRKVDCLTHDFLDFHCRICHAELTDIRMGDVTGDGKRNYEDALKILRYSIGLEVLKFANLADINSDGNVNCSDALTILRKSIGLE